MDVKDVMIGDWVMKPSNEDRETLYQGQIELDDFYLEEQWETISDCKPIPITKEILEKNGIKWLITEPSGRKTYCCNDPHINCTYIPESGWLISAGSTGSIKCSYSESSMIQYVHELQHLIHLARINKNIIL